MVSLFWFTIRQVLFDRKTLLASLALLVPCGFIVLARTMGHTNSTASYWHQYHEILQMLLLGGIVPVLCMMFSPMLITSEAESGTLVYLVTRKHRKSTILITRYLATVAAVSLITVVALVCFQLSATVGLHPNQLGSGWINDKPWMDIAEYMAITPLAISSFLAVFTLIGFLTPRALIVSGGYLVFEVVMSNIPASAREYTVTHQLRKTMVASCRELYRVFPSSPMRPLEEYFPAGDSGFWPALGVTVVALALAALLLTVRETRAASYQRD